MAELPFDFLLARWPELRQLAVGAGTRLAQRDFRGAILEAGLFNEAFVRAIYIAKGWPQPKGFSGKLAPLYERQMIPEFRALPPDVVTASHALRTMRNKNMHMMHEAQAPTAAEQEQQVLDAMRHMQILGRFLAATAGDAPSVAAEPSNPPEVQAPIPKPPAIPALPSSLWDRLLAERALGPHPVLALGGDGPDRLAKVLKAIGPGGAIHLAPGEYVLPEIIDRAVTITGTWDVTLVLPPGRMLILGADVRIDDLVLRGESRCHVIGGQLRVRKSQIKVPLEAFGSNAVVELRDVLCTGIGLAADRGATLALVGGSSLDEAPGDAITLHGGAHATLSGCTITRSRGAALCVHDGDALFDGTRLSDNAMLATAGVAGTATFRGCYVGTAEDRAIDEHRAGSVQLIDMNEAGLRRRLIG